MGWYYKSTKVWEWDLNIYEGHVLAVGGGWFEDYTNESMNEWLNGWLDAWVSGMNE